MKFSRTLLSSALILACTQLFAAQGLTCKQTGIVGKACGNGIYTYPGYYDAPPGAHAWFDWINSYNDGVADPKNEISVVYAYGSDLEFNQCASNNSGQGAYPTYNVTSNYLISTAYSVGANTISCNITSATTFNSNSAATVPYYFYGSTFDQAVNVAMNPKFDTFYRNQKPTPDTKDMIASYLSNMHLSAGDPTGKTKIVAIIDGRIDNGYLQGFNSLSDTAARAIADFIAYGATNIHYSGTSGSSYSVVGICNDSNIVGVQMDLEPFEIPADASKNSGGQASFYDELGQDLANKKTCQNGKFYSVFTFPSKMTSNAINIMTDDTDRNNFYAVYSLYDISGLATPPADPSATLPPMLVGMKGSTYQVCYNTPGPLSNGLSPCNSLNSAVTDPVPHSPTNYAANVAAELKNLPKVPFKLAIPAAASAHEFQSWYTRTAQDCVNDPYRAVGQKAITFQTPCARPGDGSFGTLLGTNPDSNAMLDYVQGALSAVRNSTVLSNANFLGMDIWALSDVMEWSPNNAIIDNNTGYSTGGSYAIFLPATPPADVISYMQNNLVDQTGAGVVGTISKVQVDPNTRPTSNSYMLDWTLNCNATPSSGLLAVSQLYASGSSSPLTRITQWIATPACGHTYQSTFSLNKGNFSTSATQASFVLQAGGTLQNIVSPVYVPITIPSS